MQEGKPTGFDELCKLSPGCLLKFHCATSPLHGYRCVPLYSLGPIWPSGPSGCVALEHARLSENISTSRLESDSLPGPGMCYQPLQTSGTRGINSRPRVVAEALRRSNGNRRAVGNEEPHTIHFMLTGCSLGGIVAERLRFGGKKQSTLHMAAGESSILSVAC